MYDNPNKLIDSTTHLYGYDLDGNLILEKNKLTGETKKYYWDSENRLIKYEHQPTDISPIDITAEYKYDIYGRRIQKNVNGSTNYPPILADLIGLSPKGIITNFMWEVDNLSLELDASNQPLRKYFTETGMDDYFGQLEYSEVTNWSKIFDYSYPQGWYGYIKDQVGTIYRVWDRNLKQYAETRTYDTFGKLINFTGATKTNLGFQGKYFDTETGLNYFYNRYFAPSIGRFLSKDPIGIRGGLNFYNFVGNDPLNFVDPLGFQRKIRGCHFWTRIKIFSFPFKTKEEKPKGDWKKVLGHDESGEEPPMSPMEALADAASSYACFMQREVLIITRKYLRNFYFDVYSCGICGVNFYFILDPVSENKLKEVEVTRGKETCGFKVPNIGVKNNLNFSCENEAKRRCP